MTITISDIQAAAARIRATAHVTPLIENTELNDRTGLRVLLKAENLQRTGSFKFRGAYNCLANADPEQRANGVVAWSSGNHAQGVAAAAKLFGVTATIVMPADAPQAKIDGTRNLGAAIVFYDRFTEDREAIGRDLAAASGAVLVPSYDHSDVVAGQGTTGLEIASSCAALGIEPDKLLIPCGGGGLSAGTAIAVRHSFPNIRISTVEPEDFDDTRRSLEAGHRVKNAADKHSLCDALLTDTPGVLTFPLLAENVQSGICVSDEDALNAVRYAALTLKLTVEPGGAVALAALLAGKTTIDSGVCVVVLSGGNVDADILSSAIAAPP